MAKQKPNSKDAAIITALMERLAEEKSYEHVLSSMCTPPSELSREIAGLFAEINLGDPGLFPQTVMMEQEVLAELAALVHAPPGWLGTITSGGSESNLIGCWAARNWARKEKEIKNGVIILPRSAHVSFEKALDLLDLTPRWIELDEHYQMDLTQTQEAIDENTVGLVGIAGATGTGSCDDIKALSDLAVEYNLFLHVDAAHGGTIFPFFAELGREPAHFDFKNAGVKSITLDTHKIMGSLIPGGSIIFRDERFTEPIAKTISYLSNAMTKQFTVTGTRPGNAVIASWVLLKKLGTPYLKARVRSCLEKTSYLVQQLKQLEGISLPFEPMINIVGFTCNFNSPRELAALLRQKGWQLSIYDSWLRIVVMPHVTIKIIDRFIADLREIINQR